MREEKRREEKRRKERGVLRLRTAKGADLR
jgi:hypothetical protein